MAVYLGEKMESVQGELLRCYIPTPPAQRYVRSYFFYCAPAVFLHNRGVLHIPTGDAWLCLHPWRSKLEVKQGYTNTSTARMLLMPLCSIARLPFTSMVSEDPVYACLFIKLRPWVVPLLFPQVGLKNHAHYCDVQPFLSGVWVNAYNKAAASGKASSFVRFVDEWLQSQILHARTYAFAFLESLCHYSEQHNGELTVEQLARYSAVSYRTLHRLFVKQFGVCPKMYLRILRFKHVCKLLIQGQLKQKTQLAYQCGYYDQPHFNHEFRQVLACAPEQFVQFIRQHCQLPFWLLLN